MSLDIQLSAVPNQSFEVTLDGTRYAITLKACSDFMAVDIQRDGVAVVSGLRCCAGTLLIPYYDKFAGFGNFAILTTDDEIPYYDKFGVSQFLVYVTANEVAAAYG